MRNRGRRLNASAVLALLLTLVMGAPADDSSVADAAQRGDIEVVRELLRDGADVNAAQGDGMTALHWAAMHDRPDMVELLVYAGANTGATTRLGAYRPLHLASQRGQAAAIRALVEAGAEVDAETRTGVAPLHFAAASGEVDAVGALLEAGAELDRRDSGSGRTPLVFATATNRLEVIDQLLKAGADPDVATEVKDFAERGELDGPERRRRAELMAAIKESQRPEGWQEEDEEPEEEPAPEEPAEDDSEEDPAPEGETDEAEDDEGAPAGQADEAQEAAGSEGRSDEAVPPPDVELTGALPPAEEGAAEPDEEPDEDEDDGRSTAAPLTPMGYTDYVGKQGGLTALHYAARDGRVDSRRRRRVDHDAEP